MSAIFTEDYFYMFTLIAEHGNLSKAADELGVTASAVSHAIKKLENHLGMPLLIRTTRNVELTEAGKYFNQKAVNYLNEFRSLERSLSNISKGIELRVGICINTLLHTARHTSFLLDRLKKNFPTCQFNISTEVYYGVWDALLYKNMDIAIGAPGILVEGGGIDYLEIGFIDWSFVIPPEHPLADAVEPVPESILRTYPSVFIEDTAENIPKRVGWLLHGQETIKVTDWNTKKQLQMLGTGIGFVPTTIVKNELASGQLIEKKVKNPRQPSEMLLAVKHDLKGEVSQWIQNAFQPGELLWEHYADLLRQRE